MFNTAGPCVEGMHYIIDPLARIDSEEVLALIDQQRYFVLHAPRQTGKTTSLLALMKLLNSGDCYRSLYVNVEAAQTARGDVERGMRTITGAFQDAEWFCLGTRALVPLVKDAWATHGANGALSGMLSAWARSCSRPVVLILDEVDALVGDTLVSLLRQLRAGYPQRPLAFPQSVILCGVRDVRDYRIHTGHNEIITGGSAFNIKAASLRMGNFTREETEALWKQHELESGQRIDTAIYPELWEDTQGQPWLVNALGREVTWEDRELRNPEVPITMEKYRQGRERLIQSRATHLDQLVDKLREPRVRAVIEGLLESPDNLEGVEDAALEYVEDIGLIRRKPEVAISNRIYREVIPREITASTQDGIHQVQAWYVDKCGRLGMGKLLGAFQQFYREHSEAWIAGSSFPEAGPQLLMQAFLQRVINGGGRITREYGLGRKRTDLLIEWPTDKEAGHLGPVQRIVIELKVVRKGEVVPVVGEGLKQTEQYADGVGADESHLVVFDRREHMSWEERIWHREEKSPGGREIGVWGM